MDKLYAEQSAIYSAWKRQIVEALDQILEPENFRYLKSRQAFVCVEGGGINNRRETVSLRYNPKGAPFALTLEISYAIRFTAITQLLQEKIDFSQRKNAGPRATFSKQFGALANHPGSYKAFSIERDENIQPTIDEISNGIQQFGLAYLRQFSSLEQVYRELAGSLDKNFPMKVNYMHLFSAAVLLDKPIEPLQNKLDESFKEALQQQAFSNKNTRFDVSWRRNLEFHRARAERIADALTA